MKCIMWRKFLLGNPTTTSAGTSALTCSWVLLLSRLISAILNAASFAKLVQIPNSMRVLPTWATALQMISFSLLCICSAISIRGKDCRRIGFLATVLQQCGSSLSLLTALTVQNLNGSRRTSLYALGTACGTTTFITDSVFLASKARHPLMTVVVPIALAIANYYVDPQLERNFKGARNVAIAFSFAALTVVTVTAISHFGTILTICTESPVEDSPRPEDAGDTTIEKV